MIVPHGAARYGFASALQHAPAFYLEALFGRRVDLVMEGALEKSPRFAKNVEDSRVLLYGT